MSSPLDAMYADKPAGYFDGARPDIVALMPFDPRARVLEIGCGNGANAVLARQAGKVGEYWGIEIDGAAARDAEAVLDRVFVVDAESFDFTQIAPINVVILSEVLEHLVDPWGLLSRLRNAMAPGGHIYASSPNVANAALLRALLAGRFDYEDSGVMDRTHLRWFTPQTYTEMFEQAGFQTLSIQPLGTSSWKWRAIDFATAGRLAHLAHRQMLYVGCCAPSGRAP